MALTKKKIQLTAKTKVRDKSRSLESLPQVYFQYLKIKTTSKNDKHLRLKLR
jgi:hypothetical protein